MKLSILMPVYNAAGYLGDTLNSVLAQTFRDFELILVDDGSPDRSGQICEELAATDSRIRVLHKENGGAATARNAGLDVAAGQYIAFVDGDDCIHPQYLEFLLALLQKQDADIAMCHYNFFTEEGRWFSGDPQSDCTLLEGTALLKDFQDHYRKVSLISLCMKLYKREIFDGLRIPEGQTAEDSLVLPMILERTGRIARSEQKLYHWRETPGSVTRAGLDATIFHRINISDFYVRFFAQRGMKAQADYFKRDYLQRVLAHYYRVRKEKPDLLPALQPYLKAYRRQLWSRWTARGLCARERMAYALFAVSPAAAEKLYRQVYGDGQL